MNTINIKKILLVAICILSYGIYVKAMEKEKPLILFDSGITTLNECFYKNAEKVLEKIKKDPFTKSFVNMYNENPHNWLDLIGQIELPTNKNPHVYNLVKVCIFGEIIKENLSNYNYEQTMSYDTRVKLSGFLGYSLEEQKELTFSELCEKVIKHIDFSETDLQNPENNILHSLYWQYVFDKEKTEKSVSSDVIGFDDLENFYPGLFTDKNKNEKINDLIWEYLEKNNLINLCSALLPLITMEGKMTEGGEITDVQLNYLSIVLQCKNYLKSVREASEKIIAASL